MTTITFIGIGPRSKCPQAQLRLDELSKRCAMVARPSSCPRRGVYVRLVARRFRLSEATAGRRRRLRRGRGYCCGVPRWPRREAVVAHYTTGFVRGCGTGRRRRSDVLYAIDAGGGVVADLGAWRGASITEARCGEHLVRGIISRTSDERSGSQTNGAGIIVVSREF